MFWMFAGRPPAVLVRGIDVPINPYQSASSHSCRDAQKDRDSPKQRAGLVVVKIGVAFSFLICVPLVLLACWAWWIYWAHQQVPQGISSFPYRAFAVQATQVAVVGCAIVLALWSAFGVMCRIKKRAAQT